MQRRTLMAGGVGHDLKNLLTPLNGYSDMLDTEGRSPRQAAATGSETVLLVEDEEAVSRRARLHKRMREVLDANLS